MEVRAIAKNVRISPKKVRLVVDQIKNRKPQDAVKILDFVNKGSASAVKKAIMSAIANAKNNYSLDEESLVFKQISASKGLTFKRYRPVSRGRAHHILKKASHLTVVLEGEEKKKAATAENAEKKTEVTEKKLVDSLKSSVSSAVARNSLPTERRTHGTK